MGLIAFLDNFISILLLTSGLKFNILGYISRGDIVPEVRMTALNLSNTGFIARDESRQANVSNGS